MADFKIGDEIIVERYPMPLVVARVGKYRLQVRMKNIPFLFSVAKQQVIWRSEQPFEQVIRSLKGLEKGLRPEIVLKKRQLEETS